MFCSQCGQPNPDTSKFCAGCGNALTPIAPEQPTPNFAPIRRSGSISYLQTSFAVIAVLVLIAGIVAWETDSPITQSLKSWFAHAGQTVSGTVSASKSIEAAHQLLAATVSTPSTIHWGESKVIDSRDNRYVVHVVFDAQNDFGAMVRHSKLVALEIVGNNVRWNQLFAVWPNDVDDSEIPLLVHDFEKVNGWFPSSSPSANTDASEGKTGQEEATGSSEPAPATNGGTGTPGQQGAGCLQYAPAVETIRGTLRELTFPGAPNFADVAKGDEAETGFYIETPAALCVQKGPDEDEPQESGIKRIQLLLEQLDYDALRPRLGTVVAVTGKVSHSVTAHHHATILLSVDSTTPNTSE